MQSVGDSFCGDVVLDSLAWYTVMKTAFKTKSMKSESLGIFIMKILDFGFITENAYKERYSTKQQGTHKIGF